MGIFLSMLRGINVGGQKKILMADLKALYEELGFQRVLTYIQSGNVIFETGEKREQLAGMIEKKIAEKYGFDVSVLILTEADMEKTVRDNPYLREKNVQEEKLYVTFLAGIPEAERVEKIRDFQSEADRFTIVGQTIYLYCPDGYGVSKLSNNFFENKLKVTGTTRNWKSVNELLRLVKSHIS